MVAVWIFLIIGIVITICISSKIICDYKLQKMDLDNEKLRLNNEEIKLYEIENKINRIKDDLFDTRNSLSSLERDVRDFSYKCGLKDSLNKIQIEKIVKDILKENE